MRVLIIEDYEPVRDAVAVGLREAGFAVDVAADGQDGLWYATSNEYDVIVLDLMLPKVDGLSILAQLRTREDRARILILSAKDTLEDRVRGLNLGADDYLIKPFAFNELLARVRALVRRKYDASSPRVQVADLEIDTNRKTVRRAGQEVDLTRREYDLLLYLALRAGEVVSRTEIWESLYEFNSDADSNVVDVYIGRLRKKLERPQWSCLIQTRRGFRLRAGRTNVMRSLRTRLMVGTGLTTALLVGAASVTLYFLVRSTLYAEFDQLLAARARALAALVEQDQDHVEVELTERPLTELAQADRPGVFPVMARRRSRPGAIALLAAAQSRSCRRRRR